MGQEETRQKQQISDHYTIVRTISPGEYLVRRKKKGDELLLRLLTFYLEEEMAGYIRLLEKRKKIKNPHLLQLVEHTRISQQNMCSSTFKIRTVVEYPFKNVKDEILERSAPVSKRYFNEDELWSILYSCCHALYSLYINKFYHECLNVHQIFIDTGGLVKIADSILVSTTKNYLSLMNEGTSELQNRYISPELVNLVEDNNFYFYQKQKSDVFILAMIILEIGNLTPLNYYNRDTKKFNFDIYIPAIGQLRSRYSEQFCQVLEKMLTMDFKERPRLEQIIDNIEQRTVYTGSSGNSSAISNQLTDKKTRESKHQLPSLQSVKKQPLNWEKPSNNSNFYTKQPPERLELKKDNYQMSHEVNVDPKPIETKQSFSFNTFALPPMSSFTSQNFVISPTKRQELKEDQSNALGDFKLQTWSFDAIMRDIQRRNNEAKNGYTPYQELVGLTTNKKDNNITSIPFANKQSSNPVQKPNISVRFSSGIPSNNSSLANSIHPVYDLGREKKLPQAAAQTQSMEIRRFSEAKFGRIQLDINNLSSNNQHSSSVNEKQGGLLSDENRLQKGLIYPIAVESGSIDKVARSIGNSSPDLKQSEHIGEAEFVIEETPHGRYEGFVSKGKRNGVGRLVYIDGGYYQGKWKEGHMDGYGKLYYQNGSVAYEGLWAFSQFNGQGRIYNDQPDQSQKYNSIDYLNMNNIGEKWTNYEGEFVNDEKNGRGTINFVNGEKFSGTFVKDKIEGPGLFYKNDGDIIQGVWHNNEFSGMT